MSSFFKKLGNSKRDEVINEFEETVRGGIKELDSLNDELNNLNVDNSTIILTSCESVKASEGMMVLGGIMGKRGLIISLLRKSMERDKDFKDIVVEALSSLSGGGAVSSSIEALAMGPNGEILDINDENLPQDVRDAMERILKSKRNGDDISSSTSRAGGLSFDDMAKENLDDFSDDIEELEDEDY